MHYLVLEFMPVSSHAIRGTLPEDRPMKFRAVPYDYELLAILQHRVGFDIRGIREVLAETPDEAVDKAEVLSASSLSLHSSGVQTEKILTPVLTDGADPVTRMVCLLVHDLNKSLSQAKIAHLLGRNRKSIIRWAKIGRELAKNREQKCA